MTFSKLQLLPGPASTHGAVRSWHLQSSRKPPVPSLRMGYLLYTLIHLARQSCYFIQCWWMRRGYEFSGNRLVTRTSIYLSWRLKSSHKEFEIYLEPPVLQRKLSKGRKSIWKWEINTNTYSPPDREVFPTVHRMSGKLPAYKALAPFQ